MDRYKKLIAGVKLFHIQHAVVFMCFFSLSTVFSTSAASETELFLVTEHLPPYQIIDDNHQLSGFSVEIVQEVLKRSGFKYQMHSYPWVRSYNLTLQKANHCIFSIARIPIRENLFRWIGRITETNNAVIWGLKEKNYPKIDHIEQIKQYLTAVNKNDATHLGVLKHGFVENKNLYILEHTNSLLNLLVTRPEIDFIIADDITIGYRAKLAGVDFDSLQRIFEIEDLSLDFYLACNKKTAPAITDKLTQALNDIHTDGFYRQLLNKWQNKMVHN